MEQEQKRVPLEESRIWPDVGRTKCYELQSRNEIPSYSIGKLGRIKRSDVERWLESQRDISGGCS